MSEDILKKITLEINKHESLEDKELKIIRFQLLKKSNILKVILRGKERLAIEEEELIKKIICKTLMIRITIEILFYKDASNISLEEVVESHWLECISDTIKKTPLCKTLLLSSKRVVEGNKVIVLNGYVKYCVLIMEGQQAVTMRGSLLKIINHLLIKRQRKRNLLMMKNFIL